jgi:hypothetical protein
MVPIHDTDVAEKRWSDDEWRQFELWEKTELRLKLRRRRWVVVTGIVFMTLASVPIMMERWPKWAGLHAVRKIAGEVNRLRRDAILESKAYRLNLNSEPGLGFRVQRAESCTADESAWVQVRQGSIMTSRFGKVLARQLRVLDSEAGRTMGLDRLVTQVCLDAGGEASGAGAPVDTITRTRGIAVMREADRLESRMDRVSVVLLTEPSSEVDFE